MLYNPFNKPIGDSLTSDDLKKLLEHKVREGFHIEYKSDFPSNDKISHSIASFANTYGGWYIVGVKTDEHNVAKEICGFSLEIYHDPISKVREVIKSHIDPTPIFHTQVVNLGRGKAVLLVCIPTGQETPFVSKDGRIYRRAGDSSHPIPETSRYTIDSLVNAGRDVKKRFEKFCIDERTFSKGEKEQGWVKIFLSPYPLGMIEKWDTYSSGGIEKLLKLSQTPIKFALDKSSTLGTGNLPFNAAQSTYQSVILRQIVPTSLIFNSLTAEFFVDGRAKFFIPLEYLPNWFAEDTGKIKSFQIIKVLNEIKKGDLKLDTLHLHFFDIGRLWMAITCLFCFYREWLGKTPWLSDVKVAVIIEDIWRSVPFFDSDKWGTYIQKFSLPVIQRDKITIPEDIGRGLLLSLDTKSLWLQVCGIISLAFGLPTEVFTELFAQALERVAKHNVKLN